MRSSILKAYAVGVITGSFLTSGAVLLATPAKADTVDPIAYAYAAQYGEAVCQTLDEYPTGDGVLGVGTAIIEDGLTPFQAGEVLYYAVSELCPRHLAMLTAWANTGTAAAA